mmetsp:Transcript_101981/g.141756  ORF Transcript_101981/g.141756 Transcript_101981/m.141756 type:complete len:245 (+) Transcript_101981:2378-3112(+)
MRSHLVTARRPTRTSCSSSKPSRSRKVPRRQAAQESQPLALSRRAPARRWVRRSPQALLQSGPRRSQPESRQWTAKSQRLARPATLHSPSRPRAGARESEPRWAPQWPRPFRRAARGDGWVPSGAPASLHPGPAGTRQTKSLAQRARLPSWQRPPSLPACRPGPWHGSRRASARAGPREPEALHRMSGKPRLDPNLRRCLLSGCRARGSCCPHAAATKQRPAAARLRMQAALGAHRWSLRRRCR